MLSREEAAQACGMKVSEVIDIQEIPGGWRVTTHDGQHVDLEDIGEPETETFHLSPRGPENPAGVPSGSEKDVLGWVGEDRERAQAALDLEQARETPRKGLAAKLQALVG